MSDLRDLKAIAEACQQHQPLRFMPSHGALYIRNDNGIVFDVHQNRTFPEFMAQNKDYADLVLAANPETILALIAENEGLRAQHARDSGELRKLCAARDSARRERDQLRAEVAGLRTGYQAYEQVNAELKAENEALRNGMIQIIEMNRMHAECQYGDPEKAESWSCVTVARAALGKGEQS
jgi:hypothetical protein